MTIPDLLAHGVGGRGDLPIPLPLALVGGIVVLYATADALRVLWRSPRFRGAAAGRPLPELAQQMLDSRWLRWGLRALGLALTGFTVLAAAFGPSGADNAAPGLVYVLFWVGLVPASLLFGPVWRQLNPLRTTQHVLFRLAGRRPADGLRRLPPWVGYWPAALGLFAFTWLELVAPTGDQPEALVVWFSAYGAVGLLGGIVFGSAWYDRCDAFETYSNLIGRLSPIGRRADNRIVLRNPFDGLEALNTGPGLVAALAILLGSTAYDSISNAPAWVDLMQSSDSPVLVGSAGLVAMILFVAATFGAAARLAGLLTPSHNHTGLPTRLAHSLVPIVVGYLVAHYFSLFIVEGQRTVVLAADPLETQGAGVNPAAPSPAIVSLVQVTAVIVGHVLGIVAAHDRAVRLFPPARAVIAQIPLLVCMVGYTLGGLTLLYAT